MKIENESTKDLPPFALASFSRALTLRARPGSDSSIPNPSAEQADEREPGKAWWLCARGMAEFRAENYEEAIKHFEKSLEVHTAWAGQGPNCVFLTMACQQVGRDHQVRDWLAKARTEMAKLNNRTDFAVSDYLSDWLTMLVVLPEAENLVESNEEPWTFPWEQAIKTTSWC